MEVLSSALAKCPSSVQELTLHFDKANGEVKEGRFSRAQTQTRLSLERLMFVLATCTALRCLIVSGAYKLFTKRSWECLVRTVRNDTLRSLSVSSCCLGDSEVMELWMALQRTTRLSGLFLEDNQISDKGVRGLADALMRNHTVHTLWLNGNVYSDASAEYVKCQLAHLTPGLFADLWL